MATVKVDKNNFKADVLDASEPVVVDFWAEWCGPCKMIGPSLEEISTELGGKVKIAKLNIDENPELAAQFGVRSIPTLMIFKGGEVADIKVGARRRPRCRTGSTAPSPDPSSRRTFEARPSAGLFVGPVTESSWHLPPAAAHRHHSREDTAGRLHGRNFQSDRPHRQ